MSRLLVAALALLLLCPSFVAAHDDGQGGVKLSVMTQNLYVGLDVESLAAALLGGDPDQLVAAVKAGWDAARASDFPARARSIAQSIADKRADVVALQEVSVFRIQDPSDFSFVPNAEEFALEFITPLLRALLDLGLRYQFGGFVINSDIELPGLRDDFTCCLDVRLTDLDVILVRDGVGRVRHSQSENFATNLTFPTPAGPFAIKRGWVAVDLKVRDQLVRFVTTHLEPTHPGVQFAQGLELIDGPLNTHLPLVVLGDFNSRADGLGTATYGLLASTGLEDTWATAHPRKRGFTCCQAADLLNPKPTYSERIDIIFTRGAFDVLDVDIVGDRQRDRTQSGLWPSDHAGVTSKLRLLNAR